jgi:actin-like protein 6A
MLTRSEGVAVAGSAATASGPRFVTELKNLAGVTTSFRTASVLDVCDDMKKSVLEVHETGFDDASAPPEVQYELPDGQLLRVKSLRLSLSELFFRSEYVEYFRHTILPQLASPAAQTIVQMTTARIQLHNGALSTPPLPQMITGALTLCPPETRRDLAPHIVLTGGGSNLKDLHKRLHWEMLANIPSAFKPRIVAPPPLEREFANWIGGSILSSLGTFQQMWISKAEYEEEGAHIIERKCV